MRKEDCSHYFSWPSDTKKYTSTDWTFFARTIVRNAVGNNGELCGYGVITGEPEAERYLKSGTYKLQEGDVVVIYTDGFSPYFNDAQFRKVIIGESDTLKQKVGEIIEKKTKLVHNKLSQNRINQRASVEVVVEKLRNILGKNYKQFELCKEKTMIVIKHRS